MSFFGAFKADPPQLVGLGDSNTAGGFGGTTWIVQFASAQPTWTVRTQATSGWTMVDMATNYPAVSGTLYFSKARRRNILVIFGGTNDINGGASAATCSTRLASLVTLGRATGYQVVTVTVPAAAVFDASEETVRTTFNATTTTNAGGAYGDVIVPLGAASGFQPADTGGANYTDGTHLSTTGGGILMGLIQTALNTLALVVPRVGFDAVNITGGIANLSYVEFGVAVSWEGGGLRGMSGSTVVHRIVHDANNVYWRGAPTNGIEFYANNASVRTLSCTNSGVLTIRAGILGSSIKVGGTDGASGTTLDLIISASATLNFPSVAAAGGTQDLTITATGAAVGDSVELGLPAAPEAGIVWNAWVSASNTVTVRATNTTVAPIDPASATFRVTVTSV